MSAARVATVGLVAVFAAALLPSCASDARPAPGRAGADAAAASPRVPLAPDPDRVVTVVHGALGCLFELKIEGVAEADGKRVADEAVAEIDRVEDALGGWRDDTDLARLNREAASQAVAPSPLLFDTLVRAFELTRETEGSFDVTVGPLVDAYGFRHGAPRLPPPDELARLRASVGPQRLLIDGAARTIRFDREGVEVDLDGLNKGVAVDRVMALMRAAGVTDASISAGGSTIGSIGPPAGQPPREIAIAGPDGEVHARVPLRDAVLSTSGNWRRTVEIDGKTYGPIFDPRSGEPVAGEVVSATAVALRGDESEAVAKAAIILGTDGARRLTDERPDLGLVLLLSGSDPGAGDLLAVARFGQPADESGDADEP